jgi:hypothetical protein
MSLGSCAGAIKVDQYGDGDFVRCAEQGEDSGYPDGQWPDEAMAPV